MPAATFESLYDRAASTLLDVELTARTVETGDGQTHVLTAGSSDAPPVVVFQGGNVTTPITLSWIQALAADYFLVAPDTPGEPGTAATPPPHSYGRWAAAVLDGLDLDRPAVVGTSHGGGVALELAAHDPDRIAAAALLVPAGFGVSFSLDLLRIVLPSLAYRVVPRRSLLDRALAPMFTQPIDTVDDVILETVGTALRTGDVKTEFPGPDDPAALSEFAAPTLVIAAEEDPFFPAETVCRRATDALPGLVECISLRDERHFLSPAGQARVTERIRAFLDDYYDAGASR
ncbi:alpha/beta fold hydrolase [Haloarcula salina]|uniref:alpha/beta fold hydrolase n=1 Tax=Haloarcula salina TaxID=1429914 RepID=UPI003C6F07BA